MPEKTEKRNNTENRKNLGGVQRNGAGTLNINARMVNSTMYGILRRHAPVDASTLVRDVPIRKLRYADGARDFDCTQLNSRNQRRVGTSPKLFQNYHCLLRAVVYHICRYYASFCALIMPADFIYKPLTKGLCGIFYPEQHFISTSTMNNGSMYEDYNSGNQRQ